LIFQVEVHGPGIQPEGVVNDKPTHFTVDVRKAGQAPLEVAIKDAFGRDVPIKLEDKRDGTIQAQYKPTSGSQHVVMVPRVARLIPSLRSLATASGFVSM
jgi:filamin